ncbi:MAG: cation:proton antiporter [Patescibacteria group bacterium]|nr:cation:proton antiporter [Patescibacteria group bacterium]
MTAGVFELTIVILIAAVLGVVAKFLRQPIILAYLAAGVVIGYFGFFNLADKETFRVFSDLGIMFLLFLVGLEINYTSLKISGKASVLVGLGQIIFTFAIGFLIATALNFSYFHAAYIAIALTFSSTIIVIKLLSDKKDLNSLYGKISVGFLLVQDFVAILILILLAGIDSGQGLLLGSMVFAVLKGLVLFAVMLWLGRKILPWLFDKIARSQELLFLASLGWVFLLAVIVSRLGFSIEIAGLLAGVALANSSENLQIASRIRPLRDFFILIFFVILGSSVVFSNFGGLIIPIIILSAFVLIGNPLIVLIIMGLMGYRRRTSFLAGVTVAQISEFSLILAALGFKLGHINEGVVALITAVGVVTITLSTYLIVHADWIFKRLSRLLRIFERRNTKKEAFIAEEFKKPIVLIGCGRTGASIAFNLPKEKLLIIEFDPEVIDQLKRHGIDYIFGDITDSEIFEKANFKEARLVVSTSPNLEDNLTLLTELKLLEKRPRIILRAQTEREAEVLYREGADYVLLTTFTSGQYLGKTIAIDPDMKILDTLKERDIALMGRMNRAA